MLHGGGMVTASSLPCACRAAPSSWMKAVQFGFVAAQDDDPSVKAKPS